MARIQEMDETSDGADRFGLSFRARPRTPQIEVPPNSVLDCVWRHFFWLVSAWSARLRLTKIGGAEEKGAGHRPVSLVGQLSVASTNYKY